MNIPNKMTFFTYNTPFGQITIQQIDCAIARVEIGRVILSGEYISSDITNNCATQIIEFLAGKRNTFDVKINPKGTDFQLAVYKACCAIPYSQTRSATDIASLVATSKSAQAVGRAIKENPISIVIPTHRVVTSSNQKNPTDNMSILSNKLRELEAKYS